MELTMSYRYIILLALDKSTHTGSMSSRRAPLSSNRNSPRPRPLFRAPRTAVPQLCPAERKAAGRVSAWFSAEAHFSDHILLFTGCSCKQKGRREYEAQLD